MSRIAMVVCSHYPDDPRPRREAEALVAAGHSVDILCLRRAGKKPVEEIAGVTARRLPMDRRRGSKIRYILEYAAFMLLAGLWLSALHLRRRYHVVHIHNMPDVLVFTALLPRLTGSRIVLDLHDPTPEVYQTKFGIRPDGRAFRILAWLERLSIRFANRILTPNVTFRNLFIERGCPPDKIQVIMNSPQESIFTSDDNGRIPVDANGSHPFIVMYHGGVYERHGIDTALHALAQLHEQLPEIQLHVYGDGDFRERFLELIDELRLGSWVQYFGHQSLEQIAQAIPKATVGLIPNKRTPFTEINMPTRIFEYLCLNRPVIAPRTRGILDYFSLEELIFFEPGDAKSLASVLRWVHDNPDDAQATMDRGRHVYLRHAWKEEAQRLVSLYGTLTGHAERPVGRIQKKISD